MPRDTDSSYMSDASYSGEPGGDVSGLGKPPKKETKKKKAKGSPLMAMLKSANGPVPYETLVAEHGAGAKQELMQLMKDGKVCQLKRGGKFSYKAN
jgi:hypothetical protein